MLVLLMPPPIHFQTAPDARDQRLVWVGSRGCRPIRQATAWYAKLGTWVAPVAWALSCRDTGTWVPPY